MALNFLRGGSLRGEKATAKTSILSHMGPSDWVRIVLRFFQFIMGIVVIGLYAQDLVKASKAGVGLDSKWLYATITGTLGAIFAIALFFLKGWFFWALDFIMLILYLTAFGIFGKMYIKEDPEGNKGIIRMKNAVWILLVNMILWLVTAAWGTFTFVKSRKARTTHTGRADQHV